MANNDIDSSKNSGTKSIAQISVAEILVALHQNAVEKCKGELGNNLRITNSAIDESGEKMSLTSAGEHIVSVILTENAAKNDEEVHYQKAIDVLKTYITWFIGPDLAKNVNESTVKPLLQKDGDEVGNYFAKKDNKSTAKLTIQKDSDEDVTDLAESSKKTSFMSFSRYMRLNEADEDAKDAEDDGILKKDEENSEASIGYYIAIDLEIEGLKRASLSQSVKVTRHYVIKPLFKYISTRFDDWHLTMPGFTIKASGLFGGGDSITIGGDQVSIKDIKKGFKALFGSVNPDDLIRSIEDRLDKEFKGSPRADVKIQDSNTLSQDLGTFASADDLKMIKKARYCVVIKIGQDDPKKQLLDSSIVANIVQMSLQGLHNKLFSRITQKNVIHIENYRDTHGDTEKIRKLYGLVPMVNQIQKVINSAGNINDAISKIEDMFQKIENDRNLKNCARAEKCLKTWKKFMKEKNVEERHDELSKIFRNETEFGEFFKSFLDDYRKEYARTEDKNLNESVSFFISLSSLKNDMMKMMFESDGSEKEKTQIKDINPLHIENDVAKLVNANQIYDKEISREDIVAGSKADIKRKLKWFKISDIDFDFGEYRNAVLVCKTDLMLNEQSFDGKDVLKNDIMSILFEDDMMRLNEKRRKTKPKTEPSTQPEQPTDSKKPTQPVPVDSKKMYDAIVQALKGNGIDADDIAETIAVYKPDKLNDNASAESTDEDAYVVPFGLKDEIMRQKYVKSNGSSSKNDNQDYSGFGENSSDLYIIPIRRLKYPKRDEEK